jgi:hypothetical protein
MIAEVVEAYGEVVPKLKMHADGWPDPDELQARIRTGAPGYGLAGMAAEEPSAGARYVIEAGLRADERPLWIGLWGGANTLAEALAHAREQLPPPELARLVSQLRVYSISDQDDAGRWIRREFPNLFYIVSPSSEDGGDYARATWTGISGDVYYRNGAGADFSTVTNEWLDEHIRSQGPLGAHYPVYLFIMEGDTPSFLGLIPNGLQTGDQPNWGGWGGRYVLRTPAGETRPVWTQGGDSFSRITSADNVEGHVSDQATIWRWREDFQNDFAARMAWTVVAQEEGNHPPTVVVNGEAGISPLAYSLAEGASLRLDATASTDPDGDVLAFRFIAYAEAGFEGQVPPPEFIIEPKSEGEVEVTVGSRCAKSWLEGFECPGRNAGHIVVAATDAGSPPVTRYRRVIITATNSGESGTGRQD